MGSPGQPGGNGRTGSGPMPARPGTGPTPTVGVTSSRPPAGRSGMRPGPAQPGTGPGRLPQPAARPSFQPNGFQSSGGPAGGGPAGGRQQDRNDWGDRTERIERIDASGYPDARPSSRSQSTGSSVGPRASGPLGLEPSGAPGPTTAAGRGRGDRGAWRAAERQAPDRREPDRRDNGRDAADAWPAPARGGAPARASTDDDPLTSKAYSRAAMSETDGRSYRVAARRSEAQARSLTDQAETFITTGHPPAAQPVPGSAAPASVPAVRGRRAGPEAAQAPAGR